jgi:KAP family P-loop domain/WD domain, G-beta repeat
MFVDSLPGHEGTVLGLAVVVADGGRALLASGGFDRMVRLWDLASAAEVRLLAGHQDTVLALAAVPVGDGQTLLASAGDDGTVRVWDSGAGRYLYQLAGHGSTVRALAAVPGERGGTLLASAGDDGCVRIWELGTRSLRRTLGGHTGTVLGLTAYRASGGAMLLASGGSDRTVRLWDPATGADRGRLAGHTSTVRAVTPIEVPGGVTLLASAGNDRTVRIWDLASRAEVRRLDGYGSPVWALAAVPTGAGVLLATGSGDGLRIWDPLSGDELGRAAGPGTIRTLTTIPDPAGGHLLATGGSDGAVRIWDPVGADRVALPLSGHRSARSRGAGRPHRLSFRGASDRPARVDLLDRADLVAVLAGLLRLDDERAAPDDGPTVISIEGPWGAGKTSALHLLRRALLDQELDQAHRRPADRRHDRGQPGRLTVRQAARMLRHPRDAPPPAGRAGQVLGWFNPSAHQSAEQVWAGLARAILDAVGPAVCGDTDQAARYWFARNSARLDRHGLHRQLWRRARSPLLAAGTVALLVPLVTHLAAEPATVTMLGHRVAPGLLTLALPALLLAAGLAHTAVRACFAAAASFLPADLFTGPVPAGVSVRDDGSRAADPDDPLHYARSGHLYLLQHDVSRLLTDLDRMGGELVLFVDDLDRCTPDTTADVLQAINLFLSESFPRARFVLGLDPTVVAAHIDRGYTHSPGTAGGDPTPGVAFLRKLIQLPVALPAVSPPGVNRLLDATLGAALDPAGEPPPDPGTEQRVSAEHRPAVAPGRSGRTPVPAPARPAAGSPATQVLERHPLVRERLAERLTDQPDPSAREVKRILTIWQFHVRLLQRTQPLAGSAAIDRARHLVIVAEILARWPAHRQCLRRHVARDHATSGQRGLDVLADAATDDTAWTAAVAELGLPFPETISDDLRRLLRDYNGRRVARLFGTVM